MLCVMIAAAFWDIFSCTLELQVCCRNLLLCLHHRCLPCPPVLAAALILSPRLPQPSPPCLLSLLQVSTTHTTAGALMGMALASYGSDAVIWSASSSTFPYIK